MHAETNSKTLQQIQSLLADRELFTSIDIHFAGFMARLAQRNTPHVLLASALISRKTGEGNICLDLAEFAGKSLYTDSFDKDVQQNSCPVLPEWSECLLKSGVVSRGEGVTPLVLDTQNRLYLRRYWEYECTIIRFILEHGKLSLHIRDNARLKRDLDSFFPLSSPARTDWQKIAALAAITRSFCVISGGPGTGKTSTVAKILAILHNQSENPDKLRIMLGAPTGKAASRLQESIVATDILRGLPEPPKATTLHRMLGSLPNSPYFRHNEANRLVADVIVIDEASMIDLPLMAKLMQAVPDAARLILLGDRHQLASVQPGSVLGDICHATLMHSFSEPFHSLAMQLTGDSIPHAARNFGTAENSFLQDSFIELDKSYRFTPQSSIARLAALIKEGQADAALDLLLANEDHEIAWSDLPPPSEIAPKIMRWPGFEQYARMAHFGTPHACFEVLERFRILCSLRTGPYGIEKINSILARLVAGYSRRKEWHPHSTFSPPSSDFFAGQPIMITRNDYSLQLFNGDIGIVLPHPQENDEEQRVFFKKDSGEIHGIPPAMLPAHETAFTMTVHKSQGSEFDTVLLILPDEDFPILTRELLYTAITRARHKVEIWGREEIFRAAIKRRITRASGLAEALWGEADAGL